MKTWHIAFFVIAASVAVLLYYHQPMHARPVNQEVAEELRSLNTGDLLVDNVGEVSAVMGHVGHDMIELRNTRDTRYEMNVDTLAMLPERIQIVRRGTASYENCAAAYIKKERCKIQ
ncbi:MAG: hypothetical protein HY918_05385 [Candidatus Doudnabacteria bacterium]|nr:hypothetical protein [Candidatus Doudnabacteria bacterium]